jgi:hypothetical protein
MPQASAIDRDLTLLARRFVSETCEFLTENWNVQREWWPLRSGSRAAAPVSASGATHDEPPPEVLRAVHVVSLHVDPSDAQETGLAGTHLFVLVPCASRIGMTGASIRTVIAQGRVDENDHDWPIWVPETIVPRGAPARPPVRLPVAG